MAVQPQQMTSFQPGHDTPNASDGLSYKVNASWQNSMCGILEVHNNSPYAFRVFGYPGANNSGDYLGLLAVQAQDGYKLTKQYQYIIFTPLLSLNPANAPATIVYGDYYDETIMDQAESGQISYVQQTNIGNAVSTTGVTSVINLSGSAGQILVEGALTGLPTAITMEVDGTIVFATLSNGSYVNVFQITPGTASTPFASSYAGNAATATTITGSINTSQINAGVLPSGVTVPWGNITGTPSIPASDISSGTLIGAVHLTTINSDGGAITSSGAGVLTVTEVMFNATANIMNVSGENALELRSQQSGSAQAVRFVCWNGTIAYSPFSVGGPSGGGSDTWIDTSGNIRTAGGNINVGGTGSTTSVTVKTSNAGAVEFDVSDDGSGHGSGLDFILAGMDASGNLHASVKARGNGQGQMGVLDTSHGDGTPLGSIFYGTTDPATLGGLVQVNNGSQWWDF